MVYLTDDLSLLLGLEEMTVLLIYPTSVSDVKKLLRKHEWKSCVSSKFAAKKLSKLLNHKIEPHSGERYINRGKAIIIYFPAFVKFRDKMPRLVFEYRYLKFSIIELAYTVHMNKDDGDVFPVWFENE
jgi:hypothetical protein